MFGTVGEAQKRTFLPTSPYIFVVSELITDGS